MNSQTWIKTLGMSAALLALLWGRPAYSNDKPEDQKEEDVAAEQDKTPETEKAADEAKDADAAAPKEGTSKVVTVTATRLSVDPFLQPYAIYRHDRDELDNAVGRTALDRIDFGPGVIIQHTSPGQTSPYIRGLTGKQSLLLFDGVRLSHATMRGGPNQYSALIPDMSIDSIDAILGSSSVVNGSDALTGALDFRLARTGRNAGKAFSPWTRNRIDSANGVQTSGGFDGETGDWRYSFEGSFYDFHDRVGGRNSSDHFFGPGKEAYDEIPNTAYDQWAGAGRIAYDGFENRSIEVAFGHTKQNDAARPDGYFENSGVAGRISRYYDPETFSYVHLRDDWSPEGLFFDNLTTTFWWHQQDEDQYREDLASGGTVYRRREYYDRVDSYGFEPQFTSTFGNHELTYGVLALFERTNNSYKEYRNLGGTDPFGATIYNPQNWDMNTTITDGAEYNTYAIYVQDLWQINDQWSLLSGVRYTRVDWDFDVADGDADDFTGNLRTSWQFRDDMVVFVGGSKSFRAPNLNDLDGATDRASSGMISFGNPNLDPEVGYTIEGGWRYAKGRNLLAASVFYTRLDDIIQTVFPTVGSSGMSGNGEDAFLRGFELQWDYGVPVPGDYLDRLALVGCLSYVDSEEEVPQADGTTMDEAISRANRFYGKAGIRGEVNSNWWFSAQARFQDAYDGGDVTTGDAGDVRLTVPGRPDGSVPGFGVFDITAGWVSDNGNYWGTVGLENIGDKNYRQLGSGADAPGFNISFAFGLRF